TTLYCDTPQLDIYHRSRSFRRNKFRLRRYGRESLIYLERKSKTGDRVRKERSVILDAELPLMDNTLSVTDWSGHWFHQHVLERQFSPVCRMVYDRVAYVGHSSDGPLRVTFDRHLRGIRVGDWNLGGVDGGLPLLAGQVIFELKFRTALPLLFKELIQAQ